MADQFDVGELPFDIKMFVTEKLFQRLIPLAPRVLWLACKVHLLFRGRLLLWHPCLFGGRLHYKPTLSTKTCCVYWATTENPLVLGDCSRPLAAPGLGKICALFEIQPRFSILRSALLPYFSRIRNPIKFLVFFLWAVVILFAYGIHALDQRYLSARPQNFPA